MTDSPEITRSETVYECRLFRVINEELRFGDGQSIIRDTIVHPGAAAALVFESPETVLLVRVYRRSAADSLLEIVAGTLEGDESPAEAIAREVEEETGFRPRRIEPLLAFRPSPGILAETLHLFVAWDLEPSRPQLDADERLEVVRMSWRDLRDRVGRGEIADGKTALIVSHLTAFPPPLLTEIGVR